MEQALDAGNINTSLSSVVKLLYEKALFLTFIWSWIRWNEYIKNEKKALFLFEL